MTSQRCASRCRSGSVVQGQNQDVPPSAQPVGALKPGTHTAAALNPRCNDFQGQKFSEKSPAFTLFIPDSGRTAEPVCLF